MKMSNIPYPLKRLNPSETETECEGKTPRCSAKYHYHFVPTKAVWGYGYPNSLRNVNRPTPLSCRLTRLTFHPVFYFHFHFHGPSAFISVSVTTLATVSMKLRSTRIASAEKVTPCSVNLELSYGSSLPLPALRYVFH